MSHGASDSTGADGVRCPGCDSDHERECLFDCPARIRDLEDEVAFWKGRVKRVVYDWPYQPPEVIAREQDALRKALNARP